MNTCSNCGSQLSKLDRFCPSCGQEVLNDVSNNVENTNSEQVVGIVSDVKVKEGMLKYRGIFLIVTSENVVFFYSNRKIEKEIMETFAKTLEGKGFKERLKENLSASNRLSPFFKDKSIADILALSPESFAIKHQDIVKVKFPGMLTFGSKKNTVKVTIETIREKHELYFDPQGNLIPEAKRIFKEAMPEKVA